MRQPPQLLTLWQLSHSWPQTRALENQSQSSQPRGQASAGKAGPFQAAQGSWQVSIGGLMELPCKKPRQTNGIRTGGREGRLRLGGHVNAAPKSLDGLPAWVELVLTGVAPALG